jgi:hypothetical protein
MKDLRAILFPHVALRESNARKILSFFGPLILFQPWYAKPPHILAQNPGLTWIRVMNPPNALDPGKGFPSILSEYHDWIIHHGDKSYTEIIKATQGEGLTENSAWEIGQMLRRSEVQNSQPKSNPALKWHLVLHFAQDLEDYRFEADRLLRTLKENQSPLRELVEEELPDTLEDLPGFDADPLTGEFHLAQIIEAWLSLFSGYLKDHELLITLDWYVMDHVSQRWEEFVAEDHTSQAPFFTFKIPDLSALPLARIEDVKEKYFNNEQVQELVKVFQSLGRAPLPNSESLSGLIRKAEDSFPWELSKGTLSARVRHLTPPSRKAHFLKDDVLQHLSGKTLMLLTETSHHD